MADRKKIGRPSRTRFDRAQTLLWVRSILVAAKKPPNDLETILGSDGRWTGTWERYARGEVNPSSKRVARIAMILPGTERYYFCPLWRLLENTEFYRSELRAMAGWFSFEFRSALINDDESADGKFWLKKFQASELLDVAGNHMGDARLAIDAITFVALMVREAELVQDGWLYLRALKHWAQFDARTTEHPVLCNMPVKTIDSFPEPLRWVEFAQRDVSNFWNSYLHVYFRARGKNRENFNVIDALNCLKWEWLQT